MAKPTPERDLPAGYQFGDYGRACLADAVDAWYDSARVFFDARGCRRRGVCRSVSYAVDVLGAPWCQGCGAHWITGYTAEELLKRDESARQ